MHADIPRRGGLTHLNNAAGSRPSQSVFDAVSAHLEAEVAMGSTEAMSAAMPRLNGIYDKIGTLVGVGAHRIAVSNSNTDAWHSAFTGIDLKQGDRILVGETEWGGNLSAIAHRCARTGARMEIVPSDATGAMDVEALRRMLDSDVRLVCVTWVPAVNGLINNVHSVAEALADSDAWFFVDAAQSFGQVAIDLSNPRFDLVTVSARKYLRAPRGTGFGVFSDRFLAQVDPVGVDQLSGPWIDGGPQLREDARKFEYGESAFAIRLGLEAAVSEALLLDWRDVSKTINRLAEHARLRLAETPGILVQDKGSALSGIVTFSAQSIAPSKIVDALHKENTNLSAPSAPYGPLWFTPDRPPIVRLSPHVFNTEEEIDRAVASIAKAVDILGRH